MTKGMGKKTRLFQTLPERALTAIKHAPKNKKKAPTGKVSQPSREEPGVLLTTRRALVVEQTAARKAHDDTVLISRFDDLVITDGTASLGDIADAAAMGTLYIVAKGEESIGPQGNILVLGNPRPTFFPRHAFRLFCKERFPDSVSKDVIIVVGKIDINSIIPDRLRRIRLKGQAERFRGLTEPPFIGLVASKARTVDAGLLSGTDADGLSVLDVADGI